MNSVPDPITPIPDHTPVPAPPDHTDSFLVALAVVCSLGLLVMYACYITSEVRHHPVAPPTMSPPTVPLGR